jgi:hypothetical protein
MFDLDAFRSAVDQFQAQLDQTEEALTATQLSPDAWSLREIVGHLVDSASNNHQRFVRLQLGDLDGFPAYEAESWIRIQHYVQLDWQLLKSLWLHYNLLLLTLVERIAEQSLGSVWSVDGEQRSLEWLVNDYYRHLRWHTDHYRRRLAEVSG